jgi:hypothetical protein
LEKQSERKRRNIGGIRINEEVEKIGVLKEIKKV